MNHSLLLLYLCCLLSHCNYSAVNIAAMPVSNGDDSKFDLPKYPKVHRDLNVVDYLHGVDVADPYRWQETPDSDETKDFVMEQGQLTDEYLKQNKYSTLFEGKMKDMFNNLERFGAPKKKGDYYYYTYNPGSLQQSVILRQATLDSDPEDFFDPNTLSGDGTVALSTWSVSKKGNYFGYGYSKSGSDWVTIRVKSTSDKSDLPDIVEFAKFTTIDWTTDEKGFFYTGYPGIDLQNNVELGTETNASLFAKVYYHKLGTPQTEDVLVWEDKEHSKYMGSVTESDCGKYLILRIEESSDPKSKIYISPYSGDFDASQIKWIKVVDQMDLAGFDYMTNKDAVFYFQTNLNAPLDRIVKYDLNNPGAGFIEVIPENPRGAPLKKAKVVGNYKAVLVYSVDVVDIVYLYDLLTGKQLKEFKLPIIASVGSCCMSSQLNQPEAFFTISGFTSPHTMMRLDSESQELTVFKKTAVPGFESDNYVTHQKFYESEDKTRVPIFIVHRKGIELDGTHPTLLYGYGGFGSSSSPYFSVPYAAFMKHFGGVVAIANIRGGGEYGEDWHLAGSLKNKQNVFNDFQYAAKYMVSKGYTTEDKLAITGASNGGLLVAACINQAPALFAAAVANVGVYDMLRYHEFTIGHWWTSEFGDPKIKDDFGCLIKYSPLHNIKQQTYPATLLMTSDHDDRVVPHHSYKFISELQYRNPENPNPLLIHIERDAGHGAGKPLSKIITTAVKQITFIAMNTGAVWHD